MMLVSVGRQFTEGVCTCAVTSPVGRISRICSLGGVNMAGL